MSKKQPGATVKGAQESTRRTSQAAGGKRAAAVVAETATRPTERGARKPGSGLKIIERGKQGFVVRDSFTMPMADYELIGTLKQRCLGLGFAVKKSELLRAGLATLNRLPDDVLAQVATAIENVKTGRPVGGTKTAKAKRKAGDKR